MSGKYELKELYVDEDNKKVYYYRNAHNSVNYYERDIVGSRIWRKRNIKALDIIKSLVYQLNYYKNKVNELEKKNDE